MKDKSKLATFKKGGVVIFPTDTVYGIGCRYDSQKAIDKIHRIKGTPKTQHFPILVGNSMQVEKIAQINESAKNLMKKHWPGGLTIILRSKNGKEKIAFRMPDLDSLRNIIEEVGPIIGTSANFHTQPAPRSDEELDPKLVSLADYVIKGECIGGRESTVVDTTVYPPKILRQGAIQLTKLT